MVLDLKSPKCTLRKLGLEKERAVDLAASTFSCVDQ